MLYLSWLRMCKLRIITVMNIICNLEDQRWTLTLKLCCHQNLTH